MRSTLLVLVVLTLPSSLASASREASHKQGAEVDLLHAVEADVAVSSAYRGRSSQADALVDGSLETAWNSRTGELAGAWIEVRLPAGARVTSIAMTAGFTHTSSSGDLFTGNHRVARVRISLDGQPLGEHALDVASRELQTLPVRGGGGVYRIEVLEVLPGSRSTWRETCISELRVMGTDPSAQPGRRLPRTAVGALPAARAATPPSRDEIMRLHRQRVAAIERSWIELEALADRGREGSAPDESWGDDVTEILRTRRTVMRQTADLVERVDAAEADALRIAASRDPSTDWPAWQHAPLLAEDLVALGHAMDVVGTFLADDAARCRWARVLAHIHLVRSASHARADREHTEMDVYGEGGGDRAGARRVDALLRLSDTLSAAADEWSRNSRGVSTRIMRLTLPERAQAEPDITAMRVQIAVMEASCGSH